MQKPSLRTVTIALAAALAFIVLWRTDLVRVFPQTASLFSQLGLSVNVRGIVLDNVKMTTESDGALLVVDGTISNVTDKPLEVPRMRFALRDGSGAEIATWTALPSRPMLGPGESQQFRTQLSSPPADGRDLLIRFFARRDLGRI